MFAEIHLGCLCVQNKTEIKRKVLHIVMQTIRNKLNVSPVTA